MANVIKVKTPSLKTLASPPAMSKSKLNAIVDSSRAKAIAKPKIPAKATQDMNPAEINPVKAGASASSSGGKISAKG
ncbi:MAG: hypothetical protein HY751_08265 [Nitrospinae bacterium]|nr:hypothetical protein [Nitrospinota bacterium]